MGTNSEYVLFWQHIFNQVEDLFDGISFEQFLKDPWSNLAKLRDPSCSEGMLLAYMNQQIRTSSDELPKLEVMMDLNEITRVAKELLAPVDSTTYMVGGHTLH